jgi:hypothetical protein
MSAELLKRLPRRLYPPELVSRTIQETLGLALGVGLVGVALGGLFSIAFAVCYGRIGQLGPRATSALVAMAGSLQLNSCRS